MQGASQRGRQCRAWLFLQLSLLSEARCFPPARLPAAAVMVAVAEVTVFAAITLGAASVAFPATVMAATVTAPAVRVADSAGMLTAICGATGAPTMVL